MKPGLTWGLGALALAAALGAGYSAGRVSKGSDTQSTSTDTGANAAQKKPKLLYYRNPMGLADTSPGAQEGLHGYGLHPCL